VAEHSHRRVGLIGDPVAHSLSPAFQQPAFDALGLDIRYELWPTPADAFPTRMAELRSGAALGANVTVPHKLLAFEAMDEVSDVARRAGAVNTIVVRDDRLYGDNTDVYGFTVPLRERGFDFAASHAVILGAGGAARGVLVALLDAGIHAVTIANRTLARAEELAAALDDPHVDVASLDQATSACAGAALLVNATALGWGDGPSPIPPQAFEQLHPRALAYDLTYRDTPFLQTATKAGVATLDGLEMLVHQGARSFALWTGMAPPIDVMLRAAQEARIA
jgi:shikimate dehydrogenase